MEPAVADHLGGCLRLPVVALHHVRPAREHFAVVGDPQFHVRDRRSDRPQFRLLHRVDGQRRRGLGQPVAFQHRRADREEKLRHRHHQRRAPRHQEADPPAEPTPDRRQHQLVGQPCLQPHRKRRGPSGEKRPRPTQADADRPVEQRAADRGCARDRLVDPRVQLLVDARHAGHHRRLDQLHVRRDGVERLSERHRHTPPEVEVGDEPFECMAEREE